MIGFQYRPYRVLAIDDVHPGDWTEDERDAWQQAGTPEPWPSSPFVVQVQPLPSGELGEMRVGSQHFVDDWCLLPEHYAVCVTCGELSPCREIVNERSAQQEMVRFERLAGILPGCCWGCGEPITARQRVHTFEGGNVWLPTAPAPVFHRRSECRGKAAAYEEAWVAADPRRARSPLTVRCTGTVVVHQDGTAECFGAVDSDCPSIQARHRGITACYAQNLGCPRECSRAGHPGARLRGMAW